MRRMVAAAVVALFPLVGGCGNEFELSTGAAGDSEHGDAPEGSGSCAKIEGSEIGVEGLEIVVGSKTLRFHSWQAKAGEASEFIGFSYDASGPMTVRVKAGGETYSAEGGIWTHPSAASDPSASAVSNVEGCDPDDSGDGDNPDGEDNPDDDGDNPDEPVDQDDDT